MIIVGDPMCLVPRPPDTLYCGCDSLNTQLTELCYFTDEKTTDSHYFTYF